MPLPFFDRQVGIAGLLYRRPEDIFAATIQTATLDRQQSIVKFDGVLINQVGDLGYAQVFKIRQCGRTDRDQIRQSTFSYHSTNI